MKLTDATWARFWGHVDKTDSCWLWTGARWGDGYGKFRARGRGVQVGHLAHRVAYELLVAPLVEGLVLDHLCRVRACVNPAHLEQVTNRENIMRGVGPSAENARKTRCPSGHLYDETNTRLRVRRETGLTNRQCWTCRRAGKRAYRLRKAAERRTALAA